MNEQQDYTTHNHITISQTGAQVGQSRGEVDFFLALLGVGLVLLLAIMLFIFGLIALPFLALVALIYGLAKL